jgi:adenosyl cobinamide kinase/adenosyl cobinamide phosphate guanylyltransferase
VNCTFIIGCARSGTSILGELIASHPQVKYIFEASHVWEWGGMGVNESHRLTAQHATTSVKKQIREWFESQADGATTNGHNGILANNNTQSWCDALARLIKDTTLRETIRRNAYQELETKHTLSSRAIDWWKVYRSIDGQNE